MNYYYNIFFQGEVVLIINIFNSILLKVLIAGMKKLFLRAFTAVVVMFTPFCGLNSLTYSANSSSSGLFHKNKSSLKI